MTRPWGSAGPVGFDWAGHVGALAFIIVGGVHPPRQSQWGVRACARCTLVILDGPVGGGTIASAIGEEHTAVVLYGSRLVPRLKGCVGQTLLHRLAHGPGQGANPSKELADPTPADEQIAAGWVNYYPGRLDQLVAEAINDFRVTEAGLLAQDRQAGGPPQGWGGNNYQQQPVQQYAPAGQPAQYAPPAQPPPPPAQPPPAQQTWPTQQPAQPAGPPPVPPPQPTAQPAERPPWRP